MDKKIKRCVFAGTFDPPTLGHKAVVEDCLKVFDEVVIALLVNPNKQTAFTVDERKEMWTLTCNTERVRIVAFEGTLAEFMKKEKIDVYVRGIRNSTDLDFENDNFYASKKLDKDITAFYLPCRQELLHVSSTMVRNSLRFSTPIDEYVTKEVKNFIKHKFNKS